MSFGVVLEVVSYLPRPPSPLLMGVSGSGFKCMIFIARNFVVLIKSILPVCIEIPGTIVPKARPIVTKYGARMPARYQAWKDSTIAEIERLFRGSSFDPLSGIQISFLFVNSLRRNSDLDNAIGAILDALVVTGKSSGRKILVGDSVAHVPKIGSIECLFPKTRKGEEKRAFSLTKIELYVPPADIEERIKLFRYS